MTEEQQHNGVDVAAIIRGSRRAERTVPLCLRGDLVAEMEELQRQLVDAQGRPDDGRLTGTKVAVRRLAEQIEALRQQMMDSTVTFRLRALPRPRWATIRSEHPPRKAADGTVDDRDLIGVNAETFFEPLVRESVVSPELSEDDWTVLLNEGLTDAQFDELAGAAWSLNRGKVDIPFSSAASRILRTSEPE